MIRPSLIDADILPYSKWIKELRQEDMSEFGYVVERPDRELMLLYDSYVKFQSSKYVCYVRENIK